jgi:predicted Zn-dependent peptidase
MGTVQGLSGVTEADLQASWSQRYVASRAQFVVVGAVDEVALIAALEDRFGDWSAGSPPPALPDPVGVTTGPRLVFVDNPDSAQTALRVVMPGWNADSDGVAAGELATVAIGGTFTSRLNRLMREEKGYTYGARAQLQSARSYGLVVAASSVQADSSAEGLNDMLSVLQGARDGFTEKERSKAFGSVRTELIESMGSRDATAGSLAALHSQGLAADNLAIQLREASAVDIAMMQDAWLPRSDLSGALVLVVGDLAEIRASVEEAVPGDWTVVDKMPTAEEQ